MKGVKPMMAKGLSATKGSSKFGSMKKEDSNIVKGKVMGKMIKVKKAKKK